MKGRVYLVYARIAPRCPKTYSHCGRLQSLDHGTGSYLPERKIMNATLQIPLRKLRSASNTLSRNSDELSRQIAVLESALNDRNLRVCAWIEEPIFREMEVITDNVEHYAEIHYAHRLGYDKYEGEWRLLVSTDWDATDEGPK